MIPLLRRWISMPFYSLSTRIALPAGFFALISVALLSFILIRELREQVLGEVVHGSENIAEAILLSLDHDMRVNRREGVMELIQELGRHADIKSIRVFNKHGRIAYSSRPDEVGRTVDTQAEACVQCHSGTQRPIAQLTSKNRSRLYSDSSGERLLATIHVIRNRPDCEGSRCHAPVSEQSLLGVLDVAMSIEPAQARLAAATGNAMLVALAAVALITGILFLMIRQSVRKPLNRMATVTRRIAQGGTALSVPESSAREITDLSESFNEMIESLGSSKQRLEEWSATLEQRLAAKADQLRQAQYEVIQAEKLSSVGLVAAGIAHELNSPLMAIVTFAHLVKTAVPANSQAQEDLRMIEREANRCAAIIRQLLDYSRKQSQEPETRPCAIGQIIDGALKLMKAQRQNMGVDVHVHLDEDLPEVEANEVQLMQVFMNLMLNALQAMPNGGELTITGQMVERRQYERLDLPPDPAPALLRIVVRDTGTGISKQDLPRVFDPFFTTKPVGKGSGLGLSVSLGLVRRYHGTILVDSDGASWTEFTVLLPVSPQPALATSV